MTRSDHTIDYFLHLPLPNKTGPPYYNFFCLPSPNNKGHLPFVFPSTNMLLYISFVSSLTQQDRTTFLYPTREDNHTIASLCAFPYPTILYRFHLCLLLYKAGRLSHCFPLPNKTGPPNYSFFLYLLLSQQDRMTIL